MAIEASKFTEKDELIAKFYTLRAGLSVIAEETDRIKAAENEVDELLLKNEKHNQEVQRTYNQACTLNRPLTSNSHPRWKDIENHKAKISCAVLPAIVTAFALVLIAVLFALVLEVGALAYLFYVSAFVVPFIVGHLCRKKATEDEQAKMKTQLDRELEKDNRERLERIADAEKYRDENLDSYLPDIQRSEARLQIEVVPAAVVASQSMRKAMLELCHGIISEADWANIDLLIFYLETGRADSLKEALQLVDQQRQNDQIISSINEAQVHISNTIVASMGNLASMMIGGFNQISNQIQLNHNEAMNTMLNSFTSLENSIHSNNKAMREEFDRLGVIMKTEGDRIARAEHINASLLHKVNESSDELVRGLKENQKYWNR